MQGEIFNRLFSAADTNKLSGMEQVAYQKSLAEYSDVRLMMDYSRKEGEERGVRKGIRKGIVKGREQGLISVAKAGLKEGLSVEMVAKLTGLTIRQVKSLALSIS
jgi:predicted transposase/invertase (TIGR01784 family)